MEETVGWRPGSFGELQCTGAGGGFGHGTLSPNSSTPLCKSAFDLKVCVHS